LDEGVGAEFGQDLAGVGGVVGEEGRAHHREGVGGDVCDAAVEAGAEARAQCDAADDRAVGVLEVHLGDEEPVLALGEEGDAGVAGGGVDVGPGVGAEEDIVLVHGDDPDFRGDAVGFGLVGDRFAGEAVARHLLRVPVAHGAEDVAEFFDGVGLRRAVGGDHVRDAHGGDGDGREDHGARRGVEEEAGLERLE
jgi:hypothetical protein